MNKKIFKCQKLKVIYKKIIYIECQIQLNKRVHINENTLVYNVNNF
jgi:hypothetical protein